MKSANLLWIFVIVSLQTSKAAVEVLKNHDMEMVHFDNNWTCQGGCTLNTSKDSYSGFHSIMVTNRHQKSQGAAQNVHVTPMMHYNFTAVIKLLTMEGTAMFETVELMMSCQGGANGHRIYVKFTHVTHVMKGIWTRLGGIHKIPNGAHSCHVYAQVYGPHVSYLLDHASLQTVPVNNNWRTEANTRIENIRKADVSISLTGATSGSYDIELVQLSHDFGFGSAVGASQIVDPSYKKYQEAFYDNFEWAVLENKLKWNQMEKTQGHIDYNTPVTALKALQSNGTKIRAHNIFWAVDRHVPTWVKSLSKTDLLHALTTRTNGVVGATKGLVEHWDVNNENIHGDWYEQATGNPNITMDMFRDAHSVDPNVKLFLNDFGIMQNVYTMSLHNQAELFKDSGVPIYGVGIQSHIHNAHLDMTTLKANLDTVAEAGLPIWITEMSVAETNENLKASALTDLLTLYFSHPSVEGVLLWGFWDGKIFDQNAALFVGQNLTANAAGRAYQTLFKTTWRTSVTRTLDGHTPVNVRGFKGHYKITVKQNGHVIRSEQFHLDARGQSIKVNIGGVSPDIIFG